MGRLFGTDGVRGIANKELTPESAYKIGKAAAFVLSEDAKRPVFVIGKDTRISGDMLENALTAGILSVGGNVIKLGIVPTPAVAYILKHYGADAGIVISASHNPYEYNGIKLFNGKGFKLADSVEGKIEDIVLNPDFSESECIGDKLGKCIEKTDAVDLYVDFLKKSYGAADLKGRKIVLDTSNGAAYSIAPRVYRELGADVVVIANEPDGININDKCGSTHTDKLQKTVVEEGADVGFAYDGDADRLIIVDNLGRVLDGDRALCLCAAKLKKDGKLGSNKLTATIMSNIGLHKFLKEHDIDVELTNVGDRYVIESMLETGSTLGGEQSGHIIFLNETTTGDGIMSSLQFMKVIEDAGKSVSELRDSVTIFPQVLVNAKVANVNKKAALEDDEIKQRVREIENKLEGSGRVLIRPSGTEPLVRVMLEGEDEKQLRAWAEELAAMFTEKYEKETGDK